MRNIMLHAVLRGEADGRGALARLVVAGHAFGVEQLVVTVEGPAGRARTMAFVHPRTHQWAAVFEDGSELAAAGIVAGVKVRAVVADADAPQECFSSAESRVDATRDG